jgi:hypothetical protein
MGYGIKFMIIRKSPILLNKKCIVGVVTINKEILALMYFGENLILRRRALGVIQDERLS